VSNGPEKGTFAVMQPVVSILIPCFNAGPWIAECIRSALAQTYSPKEILVVDDGSTDDSVDVIRSFGDQVRLETGPNRGGNVARNRLLELSGGEWLEFLDADDWLMPTKIARQMELVAGQPELDVIYSPTRRVYSDSGREEVPAVEDDDLYANYVRWANFSTTSLLLRKSAVADVGGWKNDQPVCQEHELILRLILAGKRFALMPVALGINRMQYANSVSRRSPIRVIRQRTELTDRLEAHLVERGLLDDNRRRTLAGVRFATARSAYPHDPGFARELAAKAKNTGSIWGCSGLNRLYRFAFWAFGIDAAERIAAVRRDVFRKRTPQSSPS
jgi:glycosyltransferase involved in cell wall biosynthesis